LDHFVGVVAATDMGIGQPKPILEYGELGMLIDELFEAGDDAFGLDRKSKEELMGLVVEAVGKGVVGEGIGGDFESVLTDRPGPAMEGAFLFTFDTSKLFLAAFSTHGISQ
jgi:hypothetical protein